jgi:hypothetical protein
MTRNASTAGRLVGSDRLLDNAAHGASYLSGHEMNRGQASLGCDSGRKWPVIRDVVMFAPK